MPDLTLLHGRTIATSSVRRARQLSWLCQDVNVVDIRGNVPTRIRKLIDHAARGEWHGILLGRGGLERLGIYTPGQSTFEFEGTSVHARELDEEQFLPAAGQGAVGIEILRENTAVREALAAARACAAHVLIRADVPAEGIEAHVRGGVALQRVWLTAAAVGLHLQPQMTPLIFRWYARKGKSFSALPEIARGSLALAEEFERLGGFGPEQGLTFFCRVGVPDPPGSRSLRKGLDELMLPGR